MNSFIRNFVRLILFYFSYDAYAIGNTILAAYVLTPEEIYVDEIELSFAGEMEKEFELEAIGFGACMPDKIDEIKVRFQCDKKVSVDEARWLMITLKQKLVEKVNNHEKIRPFLAEYPFPISRADIKLSFQENDKNIKNVDFVFSSIRKGKIFYSKWNGEKNTYDDLLIETYQDALKAYNPFDRPKIFKKIV